MKRNETALAAKVSFRMTGRKRISINAFDPGAIYHWIFIRVWDGSGFYIELNDSKIKEQQKTRFQTVEDVEGAAPPL